MSNRLGLSHWDAYAVLRGGCLELYYCNMAEWFWCDSLISTTNFDTVGLVIWPVKIVSKMTYDVLSGTLSLYTALLMDGWWDHIHWMYGIGSRRCTWRSAVKHCADCFVFVELWRCDCCIGYTFDVITAVVTVELPVPVVYRNNQWLLCYANSMSVYSES